MRPLDNQIIQIIQIIQSGDESPHSIIQTRQRCPIESPTNLLAAVKLDDSLAPQASAPPLSLPPPQRFRS